MKPESARFVEQAEIVLGRAEVMLQNGLNEDAARCAYMACFHVAQAFIFERNGKSARSHSGVQTEFFRLTKDDVRVDGDLRRFLSQAYEFKSVADYFTGAEAVTSASEAAGAVAKGRAFLAHFVPLVAVSVAQPGNAPKATP